MEIQELSQKITFSENSITKEMIFSRENMANFILNLKPGQNLPPQRHEHSEVIMHVLSGKGIVKADYYESQIAAGSVIHCDGSERLSVKNTGERNMSLFVVITPKSDDQNKSKLTQRIH